MADNVDKLFDAYSKFSSDTRAMSLAVSESKKIERGELTLLEALKKADNQRDKIMGRVDKVIEKRDNKKGGGNVCKTRKKMSYGGMMKNYTSENKKYGGHANMPNPRKPMGTK